MTILPPKIETLHTRIKESEVLPQDDKDALMQFSSELEELRALGSDV